jgi:hypothetical protein
LILLWLKTSTENLAIVYTKMKYINFR